MITKTIFVNELESVSSKRELISICDLEIEGANCRREKKTGNEVWSCLVLYLVQFLWKGFIGQRTDLASTKACDIKCAYYLFDFVG